MDDSFKDDLVKLGRLVESRRKLYRKLVDNGRMSLDDACRKSMELRRITERYEWFAANAWWIKAAYPLMSGAATNSDGADAHEAVRAVLDAHRPACSDNVSNVSSSGSERTAACRT